MAVVCLTAIRNPRSTSRESSQGREAWCYTSKFTSVWIQRSYCFGKWTVCFGLVLYYITYTPSLWKIVCLFFNILSKYMLHFDKISVSVYGIISLQVCHAVNYRRSFEINILCNSKCMCYTQHHKLLSAHHFGVLPDVRATVVMHYQSADDLPYPICLRCTGCLSSSENSMFTLI